MKRLEKALRRMGEEEEKIMTIKTEIGSDIAQLTRICFRFFAPVYDRHMEKTGHYRALREALDAFIIKRQIAGSLLDVSCGTGEALLHVSDFLNSLKIDVTANDFTPEMLDIAKLKLAGFLRNVTFTSSDIRTLPSEVQYETVLCSYSMHDMPSPKDGPIQRMVAAVKLGGRLVSIEEWPCAVTNSEHLTTAVQSLLRLSETPIERTMLRALYEKYGLEHVEDGSFKIDDNHFLYGTVYGKKG